MQVGAGYTFGSCWQVVLVPLLMQDFFVCLMWLGQESQAPCCYSTKLMSMNWVIATFKRECLEGRL